MSSFVLNGDRSEATKFNVASVFARIDVSSTMPASLNSRRDQNW
jgi:hypothetical protein